MTILILIAIGLIGFGLGFGSGFVAGHLKGEAEAWRAWLATLGDLNN